MFSHIYLYRLKILLRDKTLVFWTLVFPFILGTLFKLVFSGISAPGRMEPIPVAVVMNAAYRSDPMLGQVLQQVSSGEQRLLDLQECPDEETAQGWLKAKRIRGFISAGNPLSWHVAGSGLSQSIVKSFLDQYLQVSHAVERIMERNPAALPALLNQLKQPSSLLVRASGGRGREDLVLVLFYALLAMSSLYSAYYGLSLVLDVQGNLSARAARINMAPTHKLKQFLAGLAASYTVHAVGLLMFLFFLRVILNIDFGDRWLWVILTTLKGSQAGLIIGAFVGAVGRGSEGVKVATLSTVTLLGAFLAGMMAPGVKYQIATHFPLLAWINPVNLLADAYYALYYYDDFLRFGQNLALLGGMSLLLCIGVYLLIRRRQYVSL